MDNSKFGGKITLSPSPPLNKGTEIVPRFEAGGISGMKPQSALSEGKKGEKRRLPLRYDRLRETVICRYTCTSMFD